MATTEHLRVRPDYYSSPEECEKGMRERIQSNPRYLGFNQARFHAGDTDQFETYRSPTNGQVCIPSIDMTENVFREIDLSSRIDWEKYRELNSESVMNTFNYMFHKFKKGTFVKIQDNQLKVFLPFSKAKFNNEWGDLMKHDPKKYKDMSNFIEHINRMEGRPFNPRRVNKFTNTWWSNNCIVRYEYPPSEHDSGVGSLADMLIELCKHRQIPDIEFFVNKRDFPLIKRNGTEPYENLYGSENKPLISHKYDKYSPILSMTTTDLFADIPIPTWEDWARVSATKYFPKSCRSYEYEFKTPWKNKKPIAVFRGASTGCGVTLNTNMRLKVAYMNQTTSKDMDGLPFLDAGVTDWNLRPRKLKNSPYLQTIEIDKLPFGLISKLSPNEQSEYKYIINIDGHSSAFRLSLELNMNSVVLLVGSKYKMWFRDFLVPYKHYVPVQADLSDLISQIKWCKSHDNECEQIARNARTFYNTFLVKEGIFDYLQKLLLQLKGINGVYLYNYISPLDLQYDLETKMIAKSKYYPDTELTIPPTITLPSVYRSYGLLQGIHWLVQYLNDKGEFQNHLTNKGIIAQTKSTTVNKYKFGGRDLFAIKQTKKEKESLHEEFVGTFGINPLLKQIPNFIYTFGSSITSFGRALEYVGGETFDKYLDQTSFNMSEYLWILIQICLALHVAQNNCGFVHYDTYPWNIIIQRLHDPIPIEYVFNKRVIKITTDIIPILIDYDKSHIIHNNQHYGFIHMYKMSTIQDTLSILLTTVYQILIKQRLSREDMGNIILLSNFISNTGYYNGKFTDIRGIKNFLHSARKYEVMISSNKYELEERTPLDLVEYILANFNYSFTLEKTNQITSLLLDQSNAHQVFEFALSSTLDQKIQSYINVFTGIKKCTIPKPVNLFFVYYALQTLTHNITTVYNEMLQFLQTMNIDRILVDKYSEYYIDSLKYIQYVYGKSLPLQEVKYNIKNFKNIKLEQAPYSETIFQLPNQLLTQLRLLDQHPENLSSYQYLVNFTLLNQSGDYGLSSDVFQFYLDVFDQLLSIDPIAMMNNIANIETIRHTSRMLITYDYEKLTEKLEQETGDCTDALKIKDKYEEILRVVM